MADAPKKNDVLCCSCCGREVKITKPGSCGDNEHACLQCCGKDMCKK